MFHNWPVWALGAMSGTSLDGVDAAMVLTDGAVIHAFGPHAFHSYTEAERTHIRRALGQWPNGAEVAEVAALIETAHVRLLRGFDRVGDCPRVELIGFHGQTLAHDPHGRGTHQAGDGAALAHALGVPVVWDFRSADVAAGGEGAPLAPFFHHACARWAGLSDPVAFLNLGGVGNVTWVDPAQPDPQDPLTLVAFDTGPANAPINDLMEARFGQAYDRDGALAAQGRADQGIVDAVLAHEYFTKPAPKSLDRDEFAELLTAAQNLNHPSDAAATLVEIAAEAVGRGLELCPSRPVRLLVTGGGRHNPVMMAALGRATGIAAEPVEAIGLNGDMLEAQAFGYLAVRSARGLPLSSPTTTGVPIPITGGRLSLPQEA